MSNMLPPSKLFDLASDILVFLPREIRNLIYTQLFDDLTLKQVAACSQPSLCKFPYDNVRLTRTKRPYFLRPGRVPEEFALEVARQFYVCYKDMEAFTPKLVGSYLETDFFELGVKPIDVPLSVFTISADLDGSTIDGIDPATIMADCAPILEKENQNWKAFRLNFVLTSRIGFFYWRSPDHVDKLTMKLMGVLSALKAVVEAAESKGANVLIKVESYDGWDVQARDNIDKDLAWWRARVHRLMKGSQFNDAGLDMAALATTY